ncbi:hypothetical protein HAX54_043173 [Datura stramonium]|uniref:Uncharacterized protein n=1 Tax=Datura stramonium TaxID=4076 RepID=A0ABS8W2S4_DATST|nr:hypothetical protein [Datura stramonium]
MPDSEARYKVERQVMELGKTITKLSEQAVRERDRKFQSQGYEGPLKVRRASPSALDCPEVEFSSPEDGLSNGVLALIFSDLEHQCSSEDSCNGRSVTATLFKEAELDEVGEPLGVAAMDGGEAPAVGGGVAATGAGELFGEVAGDVLGACAKADPATTRTLLKDNLEYAIQGLK